MKPTEPPPEPTLGQRWGTLQGKGETAWASGGGAQTKQFPGGKSLTLSKVTLKGQTAVYWGIEKRGLSMWNQMLQSYKEPFFVGES